MTEAQLAKLKRGYPRSIWVFSLAAGEVAAILVITLILQRLGFNFPIFAAPIISLLGSGFLAYRLERRYPKTLSLKMRALLSIEVALLLGVVNAIAVYYRSPAPSPLYDLTVASLGTLFICVLHLVGLQAGLSAAKMSGPKRYENKDPASL